MVLKVTRSFPKFATNITLKLSIYIFDSTPTPTTSTPFSNYVFVLRTSPTSAFAYGGQVKAIGREGEGKNINGNFKGDSFFVGGFFLGGIIFQGGILGLTSFPKSRFYFGVVPFLKPFFFSFFTLLISSFLRFKLWVDSQVIL